MILLIASRCEMKLKNKLKKEFLYHRQANNLKCLSMYFTLSHMGGGDVVFSF